MKKVTEQIGKTVEEAIRKGLEELKVPRDYVKIEVLEEPTKGMLGMLSSTLAKVRLTVDKKLDEAKSLIYNGTCKYLFVKYLQDDENINTFINETGVQTLQLYTMTNLKDLNVEKNDYITLMNENLENLKFELYK